MSYSEHCEPVAGALVSSQSHGHQLISRMRGVRKITSDFVIRLQDASPIQYVRSLGHRRQHRSSASSHVRWNPTVRDRDAAWTLLEQARQEERLRLARDLHDQTGQQIACIKLGLHILKQDLAPAEASKIGALTELVDELAHDIGRAIADLRPPGLDCFGLVPTLQMLFEDWARQSGVTVEFKVDVPCLPSLQPDLEVTLYRVAQEALTNIMRHAGDATYVRCYIHHTKSELYMSIRDDGAGFDRTTRPSPARRRGWGIEGMRERVARVGGKLLIDSAPAAGTWVQVIVPVRSAA
ncbi:sensor histidine kinase [Methylobacterium frigidaeris]|uniref:histidine kinase n=1 Tax=Methylobacterium frigidaeris TaxID=2038277 RepID=A0AA37HEC3_9HYPH|nr:sensor histidine kinase [Methylobacterium frigidaeris]GJD64262.1 hypothetical protein MPEAHAMD_4443 [Methylobacterium frigidaeris]